MSLYKTLKCSYLELDNFQLQYVPCRIKAGAKISRDRLLEMSYSGESNLKNRDLNTSWDYTLYNEIEKHSKLRDTVVIRIRVSKPLYNRLVKNKLVLNLEDTIIDGKQDFKTEMNHGYWSI